MLMFRAITLLLAMSISRNEDHIYLQHAAIAAPICTVYPSAVVLWK